MIGYEINGNVLVKCTVTEGDTVADIPKRVTSIGDRAFIGCKGLTEVIIPNSVTSIGCFAFQGCYALKDVTIPRNVKEIGPYAFSSCISLTSVTILASIKYINIYVFDGCRALKEITIPSSVIRLCRGAFSNCNSLTSVTLLGSIKSIGPNAFSDCKSLTSVTTMGNVKSIGSCAFSYCESLTSVEFGRIEQIDYQAFVDCIALRSIDIPSSATSINKEAFMGCNLQYIGIYSGSQSLNQDVIESIKKTSTEAIAFTPECIDRLSIGLWDRLIEFGKKLCKLLAVYIRLNQRFTEYQKDFFKTMFIACQRRALNNLALPALPAEMLILIADYANLHHLYRMGREINANEKRRIAKVKRDAFAS